MMKAMMKQVKLGMALVAVMFALAAQAETYYLRHLDNYQADPGSTSSMTALGSCAGWADSPDATSASVKKMEAGNTYFLLGQMWYQGYNERNSADLRTPTGDYAIPDGAQLVFQGGRINLKNGNGKTLTVPNLTVKPAKTNSGFNIGDSSSTVTLEGDDWTVEEGAILGFHASAENSGARKIDVQAKISGAGTLRCYANPTFIREKGKLVSNGTVVLNGDFSGFNGAYEFLGNDKTFVEVSNSKALGAEPEVLSTNVVIRGVQQGTATTSITIKFNCDVTTGPNRGWDFGSGNFSMTLDAAATGNLPDAVPTTFDFVNIQPTIEVASGKTLRIEGPITGTVGLKKTGAGTLVFAHPAFAEPINIAGTQTISADTLKGYSDTIAQWVAEQAAKDTGDLCFGLDCACLGNDGETVTFETSVTNLPANTVVKFHYSTDQELWNEREIAFTTPGSVTNTIDGLTADTPYYYYFTASDGARTQTKAVRSFTTIGSAAVGPSFTLAADRRVVAATGSLAAAGCGSATASLYVQLNGVWTFLTSAPIAAGPFTLSYDLKDLIDFGTTPTFKAVVVNTSPSGRSAWTNETATAAQAFDDLTTYTWTGASAASPKRWADAANWSNDAAGADCQGYPVNGATAVFPSGANTVEVDVSANLAKLDLSAKDATIVLHGVNGAAITAATLDAGVTADTAFGATMWNSSITFDALAMTASNTIYVPQGGEIVVDHGAALKVATLKMLSTSSAYAYSRGRFAVRNGSTVTLTGAFTAGGDAVVTIDNSTFVCGGDYDFNTKNSGNTPLGATTILKGAHPLLKIAGTCLPNADYDYYVGGEFVFEIPAGGYAEAPVQMSGKYHFLDNTPPGGQTRIKVDPASAAFADANAFTQPLVQQRNTDNYYTRHAPVAWQPLRDPNATFVCSAQRYNAAEITWTPVGEFSGNAFQLGVSIPGSYAGDAPVPAPIVGGGMPGLNAVRVAAYDANGAYVPTAEEVNAGDASLRADYANASLPARSACVYVGYIYLARGAYYFWASYDDCLRLDIDGAQVVKSENAAKSGTYKCTTTGWHQLRLYLANNSGNGGPKEIPGFYYRDLQRDNTERFLVDLGDGALFRTQPAEVANAVTVTDLKKYPAGYIATLTRTGDLKRANVYANGTRVGQFAANATELATGLFRVGEAPEELTYRVVPVREDGTEFLYGAIDVTTDPAAATAAASTAICELIETTATAARFRVTASPSGATAEVTVDALAPGSMGTATVTATIDGEAFTFDGQPYTTTAIPAAAPAAVNASVKRLGANTFVYTFLKDGSITLPEGARNFRALVVAGGGAGGRTQGAGGGAGGMIDTTATGLAAGTYTIAVGKGGEPTTGSQDTTHGTNGGDSLISDAQGIPLLHAVGGGAGGNGSSKTVGYKGNDGGSGGGYNYVVTAAAGTDGQGFAGGKGLSDKSDCSGGGGGAGAAGGDATLTSGGNGGAGKASDITGEEVWYAGGGGGSANAATSTFGSGGQGGGGSASYYVPAEDGVDGLGGGGAGGSSYSGAVFGGKGGSGVVIVRFDLAPGDSALQVAPILDVTGDELVKGGYSLAIDYELKYLGQEATSVDLEILYGFAPDDLAMHQPLATGVKAGGRAVFTALMPGRTYYYAVKATNDRGFANTENLVVRKVTLKPLVEAATTLAGDLPGVWQAQFDGKAAFENDVMSSPTRRRELGPVMGFIYGDPANGEVAYTSELDGVKSYWDSARTFGYKGVIYLEGGQSYAFGAYCDDYARIVVNGETVVDQSVGTALRSHPITVAKTGWYPIELWIGNATGGAGYRSSWGARFSFAYTANPNAGFSNSGGDVSSDHWVQIRDYADGGSLLRLAPPGRGIEATLVEDDPTNGPTFALALGEGTAGHEYQVLMGYGAGYGGEIPEDWEQVDILEAANGNISCGPLPEGTRFVRFFTRDLTTGETAGAATILHTAALKAPTLGEVTATADAGGNSATFTGTAAGATTVTVYYRSASDPAERSVTVEVAADGSWTAHLTGLATGTDYTYSVVAANANGGTDRLTAQTLSTPGAGAFGSVKLYNNTGKRIRFHYGVTALGAGANTMTLQVGRYRNGESMGRDISIAYTTVKVSEVTALGEQDLVWDATGSEFDWGEVLSWKLTFASTADDGTAYAQTVTASADLVNSTVIVLQLYDPNTYTWVGGEGAWTDPANWQSDGTVNDATLPGYPDHGAKALFETPATVALDRAVEINALTLAAGTAEATNAVKIVGVGAENSFIVMQKPVSPNTANGAYGFSNFTRLELDALTLTCDGSGSEGITLAADSALVLDNRSVLCLAKEKNVSCEQDNVRFELHGDSAAFFANLVIRGEDTWVILDDGHLVLNGSGSSQGYAKINSQFDSTWKSDDCGILFSGDHPELVCDRVFSSNPTDRKDKITGEKPAYGHLRFLVPAGGYRHSPIREKGQGNAVFSSDTGVKLEVMPESPCFAAAGTTVTRLVDWPYKGITGTAANKTVVLPEGCSYEWKNLYASPTAQNAALFVTLPGKVEGGVEVEGEGEGVGDVVKNYGPYEIHIYTNVNETAYFTLDADAEVEVLLVGGGGAGGWGQQGNSNTFGGGGGGAGGVLSKALSLKAGVYPIRVGRGGMNYPSAYWVSPLNENGLDSTAFGLVAYGGGAGGTKEKTSEGGGKYGQNGGSGGGNTVNTTAGQAGGVAGQGYSGGVGSANHRANGGGGAGAAAVSVSSTTWNTDGGAGRVCDITGVNVIYGGGGGGGGGSGQRRGGCGGLGGGGHGLNWNVEDATDVDGVNGLGGGGGGGAQDADRGNGENAYAHTCTRTGGKGGDGVVIVRVKKNPAQTTALREATPTVGGAIIAYEDFSTSPSTIKTIELTGYGFGVATNYTLNGETIAFTTLAENPGVDASLPGLFEAHFSGKEWNADIVQAAAGHRELGPIAANNNIGWYSTTESDRFCSWGYNDTYGYAGYMFMEAGKTYYFGGYFDNQFRVYVDGTMLWETTNGNNFQRKGFTPPTTGWYTVDFRFYHSSGDQGAKGNFAKGLMYTTDPEVYTIANTAANNAYSTGWIDLVDPGDGSLFRTVPPADRILHPQGVMRDAAGTGLLGSLVAETPAAALISPALDVWAVTGEAYLENATTNDWIAAGGKLYHVGVFAADANALSFKLAELGAANYVRFVGFYTDDAGEHATWSETVLVPAVTEQADATPVVSVAAVSADAISAEIAVDVLYAGGENCDVVVKYGLKPDALTKSATILTAAGEGQSAGVLGGLSPNHTYYAAICATSAGATSADSEVFSFSTAAAVTDPRDSIADEFERTVEIVATNFTGEVATSLTVQVGPGETVSPLVALVGKRIGDLDETAWTRKVTVAEAVPVEGGTYDYPLDANWGVSDFALIFAVGENINLAMPFDAQVEYIQSTGSEWIDAGVKGKPTTTTEVDFQFTDITAQQRLFGSTLDVNGYLSYGFYINGKTQWASAFNDNVGDWATTGLAADMNRHTAKLDAADGRSVWIDGVKKNSRTATPKLDTCANLAIFGDYRLGGVNNLAKMKLYSLTIKEAGESVRDFYPVRKDGKGYLYDSVSGEIYGNAAANGNFLIGTDVATTAPLKASAIGASAIYYWTDPTAPRVVSAEATELASGCSATIAGTAANAVAATVTVGETVVPAIFAEGAFTATVTDLTPGATYDWFVTVESADGEIDSTPAASFTLPGEAALSMVTTVTRDQRHVTLAGTLTTVGAGTNVVTLLVGTATDNLAPVDCRLVYDLADYDTLTPSQPFTLEYDLAAFGGSYYFGVRVENACFTSEAGSWTKEVANTTQVKVNDDAIYTWVGNEPHDSTPTPFTYTWTNPANWNCSSADRWDYPANSAKVEFPAGTATVEVDVGATLASWTFAEGADVTLVSANGSALTVSGHWKQEKIAVVTLGEGLNAVFSGDVGIAADGAELVVSNATVQASASGVFFDKGGRLCVKGERPLVKALRFRTYAAATADGSVVFTVPANGWTTPPIQGVGSISENAGTGGGRNVVFSVDPASPACHVDSNLNVPLLGWSGSYGIDTEKIAFANDWPDNDVDYGLASESATGPWYPFATWTGEAASTHGFGAHIEGTLDGRPILRYPTSVAIGPGTVTLQLKVVPGAGTEGVQLKAVVWPTLVGESAAVTNDIAFVTAEDDTYLFTLSGLTPETAYRVYVVGTSVKDETALEAFSPIFDFTTAEVAESSYLPQLALVEGSLVTNADMTAAFDWQYIEPGYLATGCDFVLEYWHDATTNAVSLAGIDTPQQIHTVTPPLKPNTVYGFRVKAENDLDPARVSYTPVVEVATFAESAGFDLSLPDGYAQLQYVTFTGSQYFDLGFADDGYEIKVTYHTPTFVNDGHIFGYNNNSAGAKYAHWTEYDKNGVAANAYYYWGYQGSTEAHTDFRWESKLHHLDFNVGPNDEIWFDGVKVGEGKATTPDNLRIGSRTGTTNYKGNIYSFEVFDNDGEPLARYVPAKCLADSKVGFWDLASETFKLPASGTVTAGPEGDNGEILLVMPGVAVEDCAYDGSTLAADLEREGDKPSDLYACYGATYGGAETNGWEHCEKLGVAFREGVSNLTVAAVISAGANYVRFFSAKDGWSEAIFLPETPVTADPQVKLAAFAVLATNIVEAAFSVDLNGLGTGAAAVDLFAVYSHDDFCYTNQIAAGVSTFGTLNFELLNLKPSTAYAVYVFATNGLAGGYAETAPIAFATTEEESYGAIHIELPAGYTRLDYVESNGKQWVDTGVKPTAAGDYSIVMDFRIANYSGTTALFGSDWGWNGTWLLETYNSDLNFDPGVHVNGKTAGVDQRFTIDGDGVTMVNLETGASTTTTGFTRGNAAKNLGLFAVNGGNNASTFRLYRWQAFAAGELVRDFVPCKDANGVACLYDLVSKTPFYSKTSTALIAGPDYSGVDPCEMLGTDSVIWDGTVLTAVLSREGTEESDLYACYGATYGGAETNGWENVVKVGAFPAEVAKTPGVIVPTGANYVRYFSEKDGWSEAIFLPETPVMVSEQPIFGVTAVKTVRETSAQFLGYLAALGEGASSTTIIATYGETTDANDDEQTILTINTAAFDPSVPLDLNLLGLTPNRRYYVRFHAVNDRGVESALTEAFEIDTIARGSIGAEVLAPSSEDSKIAVQSETRDLETGERVIIFSATSVNNTDTPEPAVFRVTTPGYAEVLVVGGGGAGACYTSQTGGGGGAGGFQYVESMYFEPGDYLMAVGPGAIARAENGYSGRKSTITFDSEVLVEALGGDGGRRANNDGTQTKLTDKKASGGGKVGYHAWVNLGTPGQGHDGGNGCSGNNFGGSGGGGAGAPGGDALIIDDVKTCGNGGDGLPCAITGETLYYAGGGGGAGAGNDVVSGRGGLGGGGSGTSGNTTESIGNRAARNAVNGLGGGGGAGGNSANPPGNGGSGTIILRFVPEDEALAERPVVQLNALTPVNDANDVPGVDVSYRVVSEGAGKLVTVDFEYGTDTNAFRAVRFADGAYVGNYAGNFTGLRANVIYYGRLKVTDEQGEVSYSRVIAFTTLDGDDSDVDPTAPRFGEITYGTTNRSHQVEITATGTNFVLAADTTTVKLLVGADPVALVETPATVAALTDEAVTVFCDAVDFDTPYYGALVVDNGDFLTQSPVLAFTVSGASVLLSSAVSVSADSQRTLVFSGVVKSLGAGETTAKLYLSTVNASSLELAQTIAVTATGYFEFAPVTFEWDQTAYYRIDVENSFQDQKWTSAGTAGNKMLQDTSTYLWIGATGGLWHDAANWEVQGEQAEGVGYPTRYATAKFPSDATNVISVGQSQLLNYIVLDSSNAKLTLIGAEGTTRPALTMPDQNHAFSFDVGSHFDVVLDNVRMAGTSNNDHIKFGAYNTLTLIDAEVSGQGNGSGGNVNSTSNVLAITEGSYWKLSNSALTLNGTDSKVLLVSGSTMESNGGNIEIGGTRNEFVISNATLNIPSPSMLFSGTTSTLRFAGKTPVATVGGLYANADKNGKVLFDIPVGGYAATPIQMATGKVFANGGGTMTVSVPADAPVVLAETDGDYQLVTASDGISTDKVILAELPHPDTDSWYWTYDGTDAREGTKVTGLGVHLVGRPSEPTAPLARLLHVKESTADSVTFAADFRCGGTSPSATWSYWLDDETEAEATPIGTFTEVENFEEFTVGGLEKGSQHVLHLKGVSEGGESVVDYDFGTVGDWATLGTVEGVTTEPYGPYTKIVADAETEGVFEVLVACEAELSFDDGEAVAFTLNTGTYTVKNGVLANEAEAIAELAGAETLTIKVQTREVENEPLIDVVAAPVGFGDVTIPLTVFGFGGELTRPPEKPVTEVTVKLLWGYHPEHLVYETDLGTVGLDAVEAGVTNLTVTTLPSDTFFYAKVVADNGEQDGVGTSHLFTFQTVSVGDGMLYQASKKGFKDEAWNVLGDESCVLVPGGPQAALHGNKGGGLTPAWSDADGNEITWVGGSMYGYVGYIHLQAMNYAFVAGIDDNCRMRIYSPDADLAALANEEPLFTSGANFDGNNFKPQVFACPDEGWYAVEIFVGDGTGQYGAYSVTRKLRYCELGDGETAPAENDASWCDLVDSGDGSRFSSYCGSTNLPVYDESAPVVSSAVADVSQGNRMTVTCTVEGAETFSMLIGGDAAMSGWAEVEVEGEERVFTLSNLAPGTNFWWQLVARSAAGVCVATVPQQAVMPAEASFASGPTVTTAQDALTVKGSAKLGAGETWVLGAFTVGGVTTNVVLGCWTNGVDKQISSFDWTHTFSNAWNEAVGYSITLSNGVDGVAWTSEPVVGSKTLTDTATYTWVARGVPGAGCLVPSAAHWNDPANWSCDKSSGIGYPTETSTARFEAADGADIVLDQDRTVKTFTVVAGARIVFSGPHTFTAPGTGDLNFTQAGITLGAKDGATFRYAGALYATADNQTFLADNATLHFNSFYTCKDSGKSTTNCTIRLSGAAPLFLSQGGFGPRQSSADYTIVLNVPVRGWTEPVIRSNGLTKQALFGATDQASARTTKFRFAVDPDSPFFRQGGSRDMVIVDWPYGFSAENLDLEHVEKPKRARKCEFSLNAEDPAAATLLKLRLAGWGFVFIIR